MTCPLLKRASAEIKAAILERGENLTMILASQKEVNEWADHLDSRQIVGGRPAPRKSFVLRLFGLPVVNAESGEPWIVHEAIGRTVIK